MALISFSFTIVLSPLIKVLRLMLQVSRSRRLFSVISLLAITISLVPRAALSQSQYVTDYGKKIPPPAAGTTGSIRPVKGTIDSKTTTTTTKTPDGDTKVTTTTTTKTATGAPATAAAGTTTAAPAKTSRTLTIVKPQKHVATGGKWNQFADYIILRPGQETLPLTLTINNGGENGKPMRAIRATLSGRDLFNEKSFNGKNTLVLDLTGALSAGSTQIVFQCYGDQGSYFTWDLTSKSTPTIKELSPKSALIGASVKAVGKLLPIEPKSYQITVGGKVATVTSATTEGVEFKVPDGIKPDSKGEVPVLITAAGIKFKAMMLKIGADPEISSFSHVSISSQQTMTISGKNFGKDPAKVKVTFGGIPGDIVSLSDTSITVRTPEITDIPSTKEVQITVDGNKCKKPGILFFSMRNVENSDGYSPFSVPGQFQ